MIKVSKCHVSGVEIRGANNEAFVQDASVVNRSSDDDITLCENTLYAQTPQPQLVPCAYVPLHEDDKAHGISIGLLFHGRRDVIV